MIAAGFLLSLAMRVWRPSEPTGMVTHARVVNARFDTQRDREYVSRVVDLMKDECSRASEVGAAVRIVKAGSLVLVNPQVVRIETVKTLAREIDVVFFDYTNGYRETHKTLTGFAAECVQIAL